MSKIIIDLENKYFCYLIGLLWADGYIYSNNRTKNRIDITMLYDDISQLEYIFDKTGEWRKYERRRKNKSYKKQLNFRITNSELYMFLEDMGYNIKSKSSPVKILSSISYEMKRYFIKGLFDGDGCFYHNNHTRQCSITSNYSQDWTFMQDILSDIGCSSSICRQKSKFGNKSSIRITNKDILKFGHYLYEDIDIIGIHRKYDKFKEIEASYLTKKNRVGNNKKVIYINNLKFESISEAAKSSGLTRPSIRYRLKSEEYPEYRYSS